MNDKPTPEPPSRQAILIGMGAVVAAGVAVMAICAVVSKEAPEASETVAVVESKPAAPSKPSATEQIQGVLESITSKLSPMINYQSITNTFISSDGMTITRSGASETDTDSRTWTLSVRFGSKEDKDD